MSAVSFHPNERPPANNATAASSSRRWIFSSWFDLIFIILTPLLATPIVLLLYSNSVGIEAETISLIVTAFFATGHHLPGLLRAYGDRELFERFKWRFLFAPPLIFLSYFPLYTYHFPLYRLIILVWATWHGLMQLYGFMRIYDAKVGSVSRTTAFWDWLICLIGFITPQLLRPDQISNTLGHWYAAGGPVIPSWVVQTGQWGSLAGSIAVFVGYLAHYAIQSYRGPKPSSLKLLMLVSGVGLWWFVMLSVENLLISVALFDICHDIQYLAIVWLFNCRRVTSNASLGVFMRYVFRRGMVLLYLGLIASYGAFAFAGSFVLDGTVSRIFYGVIFTSTVLHYYYDGFIWKVRERENIVSLGIESGKSASTGLPWIRLRIPHLVKWSPAIVVLGLLFSDDLLSPPMTTSHKNQLEKIYAQSLMGNPMLPKSDEDRSWIYSQYEHARIIAETVKKDRYAQLRLAILLANFGNNDEAMQRLETLRERFPDDSDILLTLGGIQFYRGNTDAALKNYLTALEKAKTSRQRALANFKLGEHSWYSHKTDDAEFRFGEALRYDPSISSSIDFLRNRSRD